MKTKLTFYTLTALALVLGACTPSQPTQSAEEVAQQIRELVALTVAAGDAQTAAAQAQFTVTVQAVIAPSSTPFPTLTPFATLTPFVVVNNGGGGSGGGGGGGGTTNYGGEQCGDDPKYMGAIIDEVPHEGSADLIRKTGEIEKLDVRWTIKNVGTKTWQPNFAWMFFEEIVNSDEPANKLLTLSPLAFTPIVNGPGPLPIGDTIETGEFITLGVELTMPASIEGRDPVYFTVRMVLVGDSGYKFCFPYTYITVIRPGMTP